jgi:hypothetical protein
VFCDLLTDASNESNYWVADEDEDDVDVLFGFYYMTLEESLPFLNYIQKADITIIKEHLFDNVFYIWLGFIEAVGINYVPDDPIESEWETLYSAEPINKDTLLLRTYGGGPEGGYALKGRYNKDNGYFFPDGYAVYSADRTWGQPWTLESTAHQKVYVKNTGDGCEYIKVVSPDEVLEGEGVYEFGVEL